MTRKSDFLSAKVCPVMARPDGTEGNAIAVSTADLKDRVVFDATGLIVAKIHRLALARAKHTR